MRTARRGWRARAVAATVLLAACQRPSVPTTTPPEPAHASDAPTIATTQGINAWLAVEGVGATEAEAEARAREQLAARLLGDPQWQRLLPVVIHDPARDVGPVVIGRSEGEVRVALGLSKVRAVEVVSSMEMAEIAVGGPAAWRETLYAYMAAHTAAHACERRRELFEAQCEPGELTEVDAALAELASAVSFAPEFSGGLPTDEGGAVLRVPEVFVLHLGAPLAGVPVRVRSDASSPVVSDALGRVAIAGEPSQGVALQVDAQALLGPLASAWPQRTLELQPRRLDPARYRVLAEKDRRAPDLLDAVDDALQQAVGRGPSVASETTERDLAPTAAGRAQWLRRMTGRGDPVDFIVLVGGRWGFASRMGGGRVWYEASGFIEVVRAWDGVSLARVQTSVRANGVGDRQAETAARGQLVQTLLAELQREPGCPWASGANRVTRASVATDG